jgi:hypothetical protein
MMGQSSLASSCAEALRKSALAKGGFSMLPGGVFRPEATAWAVLSLALALSGDRDIGVIEAGRDRLAASQLKDGRVSVSPSDPGSFWPTSLAILAWQGSRKHAEHRSRAIGFLLNTSGRHWAKQENSPLGHDTSITGWPWTQDTHSWVEPTSLSILALRVSGFGGHTRVREGVRMLMDRQLPSGGWNYGNNRAFGTELFPQADCTGIALSALAGEVPQGEVGKSVGYLQSQVARLRTPLSLGWGILGLGGWEKRPEQTATWLGECMARQDLYGVYDTSLLSLLLLALEGKQGLVRLFA